MSLQANVAVLVVILFSGAMALEVDDVSSYTFDDYKKDFGREYAKDSEEHRMRESIFKERSAEIQTHNAQQVSWKMGINEFTDRTEPELKRLRGNKAWMNRMRFSRNKMSTVPTNMSSMLQLSGFGDDSSCTSHEQACANAGSPCCNGLVCGAKGVCEEVKTVPSSFDWSELLPTAKVILNQGPCGSCWAVASVAALQLQAVINTEGKFRKQLSAQNLLSCTENPGSCGGEGGCQGATGEIAYEWLKQAGPTGGVHTVDQQRYTASETKSACPVFGYKPPSSFLQSRESPRDAFGPAVSISDWKKLAENNAEEMVKHLVTVGPLVGSVVGDGLYPYRSGIIPSCASNVMDHAVVMMGYGEDPSKNMMYWNIRNSWGTGWGEQGYFRLQKHYPRSDEPCNIDPDPSKGVACKDKPGPEGKYPETQTVCGACAILGDTVYPVGTHVPEELFADAEDVEQPAIKRHEWA